MQMVNDLDLNISVDTYIKIMVNDVNIKMLAHTKLEITKSRRTEHLSTYIYLNT